MIKYALILLLGLNFCSCIKEIQYSKITPDKFTEISGHPTKAYPEVGLFLMGTGRCSAFLIQDRVAITAKHCIEGLDNRNLNAVFISSKGSSKVIWVQPYFNKYKVAAVDVVNDMDIAAVGLKSSIPGPYAQLSKEYPSPFSVLTVVGFGCSSAEKSSDGTWNIYSSGVKRYAQFRIGFTFNYGMFTSSQMLSCPGDSGGPVYDEDGRVVGLTSGVLYKRDGTKITIIASIFADTVQIARSQTF